MGTITLNLPIVGQPDSTEEPKIPTALTQLQTLLNGNLDRSNLAIGAGGLVLTAQNANYAAVSGDYVFAGYTTVPLTITAPAVAVGARFAVIPGLAASGTAGITINPHGSELFFGLGFMGGASGVLLGTPGGHIQFICDGVNWVQASGMRDTGWMPLTLHSVTGSGAYTAAVRIQGDIGELCGAVTAPANGVTDLAALPVSWAAPALGVAWDKPYQGTGGVMVPGRITLNGTALALTGGAPVASGSVFSLNGLRYRTL